MGKTTRLIENEPRGMIISTDVACEDDVAVAVAENYGTGKPHPDVIIKNHTTTLKSEPMKFYQLLNGLEMAYVRCGFIRIALKQKMNAAGRASAFK